MKNDKKKKNKYLAFYKKNILHIIHTYEYIRRVLCRFVILRITFNSSFFLQFLLAKIIYWNLRFSNF